jgi:uncharacterized protein (DUF488 family)
LPFLIGHGWRGPVIRSIDEMTAICDSDSIETLGQSRMTLYTFGYEGISIDAFISRLKKAKVSVVLDVRELPLSRKPGFSKNAFAAALSAAGIEYAHLSVFGCPKPIRDRYRANGKWSEYVKSFSSHLSKKTAALTELANFVGKTNACLVCFEADFNLCHRSMVARAAARAGNFGIVHLTLKEAIPDAVCQVAA